MTSGPPYLLAIVFGLVISATLYFILVWPRQEPEDEGEDEDEDEDAGPEAGRS